LIFPTCLCNQFLKNSWPMILYQISNKMTKMDEEFHQKMEFFF
jgi:hypothetical protein